MKRLLKRIAGQLLLLPVYFYRLFISPLASPACRHTPTCSQYAIDAVRNIGPVRGIILASNRILRCRPGGTHGYDPAPRVWVRKYRSFRKYKGWHTRSNRLKDHN